jgi:hypothetical protein
MPLALSSIRNPIRELEPNGATRDPALIYADGVLHCFHTAVEVRGNVCRLYVDVITSHDGAVWSQARRLTRPPLDYSSPGNVFRHDGRWVMCLQSYPTAPGNPYGSDASRLWLMHSDDLISWGEPEIMVPEGCVARWAESPRQIDPYIVEHDGLYWCFYKAMGQLGLLVSQDLRHWEEALPNRPALAATQTPDGATVENPCVICAGDRFVMFFAPCRRGRGVGVAYSSDLLTWRDVHYVAFPDLPWANDGPTAPMVIDIRDTDGIWLMAFHGDRRDETHAHAGALGLAWSQDLEHWQVG